MCFFQFSQIIENTLFFSSEDFAEFNHGLFGLCEFGF